MGRIKKRKFGDSSLYAVRLATHHLVEHEVLSRSVYLSNISPLDAEI